MSSGSGSNTATDANPKSRQKAGGDAQSDALSGVPLGSKSNTYSHPSQMQPSASSGLPDASTQPAMHGQVTGGPNPTGMDGNNSAALPGKKRRSSNQGLQRANYNSSAQSHQSMPPPANGQLAPLSQTTNLQQNSASQLQVQKGLAP